MQDDTSKLTLLGGGAKEFLSPSWEIFETFLNQYPEKDYQVSLQAKEYTSLCPKTGYPDCANITIEYTPKDLIIETKSLKLYLCSFRNERVFMETACNRILQDLVKACNPKWMEVIMNFSPRGGIYATVVASHYYLQQIKQA